MIRFLISMLVSLAVVFGLFLFMAGLISTDAKFEEEDDRVRVQLEQVADEKEEQRRERRKPKKPPPPKEPPPPQTQKLNEKQKPVPTQIDFQMAKLDIGVGGDGPFLGNFNANDFTSAGDGEAIAVFLIQPTYPRKAAIDGLEGYVTFTFTVNPDGSASNVSVLDEKPRRVFTKEARRALLKTKFKPKVVDGRAVPQPNMRYTYEFTFGG